MTDNLLNEINRLRPHYLSQSAIDAGRRQMLDHFLIFLAATGTQEDRHQNIGNNCSEDGQPISGTDCGSGIVERLRADDFLSNRGPDYKPLKIPASALRLEAASEIIRLQEALAAVEARIAAKDEALRLARSSIATGFDTALAIVTIDAALTSNPLPALLAETRKKALEEAAKKADAFAIEPDPDEADPYDDYEMGGRSTARSVAAAIRSLSNEEINHRSSPAPVTQKDKADG